VTSDAGGSSASDPAAPATGGESGATTEAPPSSAPLDGRTRLGYALLFSAPVGVGVAAATMRVTGAGPSEPVVFGPGAAAAGAVFLLVAVASRGAHA
jgi:hypothetical protein